MNARSIALAIVRRYPKPWRDRYEAEVSALIEDSDVRVCDLGELVRIDAAGEAPEPHRHRAKRRVEGPFWPLRYTLVLPGRLRSTQ
jgi:hypothetical protein